MKLDGWYRALREKRKYHYIIDGEALCNSGMKNLSMKKEENPSERERCDNCGDILGNNRWVEALRMELGR